MKKACKLFILIALLTGCSLGTGQTTQQRYYALKSTYKEILEAELIYVQDCYEKDTNNLDRITVGGDNVIEGRFGNVRV